MTKRRADPHAEVLQAFVRTLKQDVKESLFAWQTLNGEQAAGRRNAYAHVVTMLKRTAEAHGLSLADIGLVDYEVPKLRDMD